MNKYSLHECLDSVVDELEELDLNDGNDEFKTNPSEQDHYPWSNWDSLTEAQKQNLREYYPEETELLDE
jgi:hypothetical protein